MLTDEFDAIGEEYRDGSDLPDAVDARLTEIDAEMTPLVSRPVAYDPEEQARAGVFVSLMRDGRLRIDRGYVRAEDEPGAEGDESSGDTATAVIANGPTVTVGGQMQQTQAADEEDDTIRPLPNRLVSELTAERTLALRDALANAPDTAFIALLYALCLSVFRSHGQSGCVQIGVTQSWLGNAAPNLRDSVWSTNVQARHEQLAARLPDEPEALWAALVALAYEEQMALLAHCVSLGVGPGFGNEIEAAKTRRLEFLESEGLAQRSGDRFVLSRNLLATLRERDLADAGVSISREHNLRYRQSRSSGEVSGVYRKRVQLASGRFAMIDDGLGFSLVPWSKQLDRRLGQYVSGTARSGGGIEWTLGRSRSIEI